MEILKAWEAGLALLLVFGRLTCAACVTVPLASVCPLNSVKDSFFGSPDSLCPLNGIQSFRTASVIEGDEVALQRALNMVHKNRHDYVAVLFYATWCPFSGAFRPNFSVLSSFFPFIPHFAIEESAVRPSTLSKYGVHGFPTLFLLNSTMRVRYHGTRTLDSLIAFYAEITGTKTESVDTKFLAKFGCLSDHPEHRNNNQENCPFPWARSPENLLQQETYLALASAFVLLRLFYIIYPSMRRLAQHAWHRYILNLRPRSMWEHPVIYINRAVQLFSSLKEPCKRSNLQGGAMNAKAWASKSLATVSFGDASTSRIVPLQVLNSNREVVVLTEMQCNAPVVAWIIHNGMNK